MLNNLLGTGRSPDYEVRKSDKNKKGSMDEFVHVQQESFNDTPSKVDGIEAVDYSRWDDRSTLESAVALDLAEKQIEISHKSERGFALYVYGVRCLSSVILFSFLSSFCTNFI